MDNSKSTSSTKLSPDTSHSNFQPGQSTSTTGQQNTNHEQGLRENPLFINVVFLNLLKCGFSLHDLQQIRLVCKDWNKNSLNKWRSRATIRLGPTDKNPLGEVEWSHIICRAWDVEDYLRRFNDTTDDFYELAKYPYTKYNFIGFYLESSDIFLRGTFWDVLGPNIQQLKFERCTFPGAERANDFDQIFIENLQSLETLEFLECQIFPHRETEKLLDDLEVNQSLFQASPRKNVNFKNLSVFKCLPMDLSLLLINSPNIESISLDCQYNDEYRFYQKLAEICIVRRTIENLSYPLRQIKLNLKTASVGDTANFLTSMNFPLEHLSYAAMPLGTRRTTGISVVSSITASCANTLKTLELFQPPVYGAQSLQNLPGVFNNLEEIHCYGNVFEKLDFLKKTSNLKVLHLDFKLYNNLDKIYKLTKGSDYLRQLRDCYFPRGSRNMTMDLGPLPEDNLLVHMKRFHLDINLNIRSWTFVNQWMPNLKILEAPLRQELFREVCRHFTNLEELVLLYESYVGDDEITGFKGNNTTGRKHNLTHLKALKRFVMKRTCVKPHLPSGYASRPVLYGCDEADRLGDRSVFQGFLEMKNLEEIQIHVSEKTTDDAVKALKKHVAKVDIIRSYGERPHGNGECCKVVAFLNSVDTAREHFRNVPVWV